MPTYEFEGLRPVVDPAAFVHPDAVLIGDVVVGPECYVGPGAALRGDMGRLTMGRGANLQDGCIVHSFPQKDVLIDEDAHIGHGAVLHGCVVQRNAMVGMNAVVMDGAEIGDSAIVAALAFIKAGMKVPARTLVAGVPCKIIRELKDEEIREKERGTRYYQLLAAACQKSLRKCEPLGAIEEGRGTVPVLDGGDGDQMPKGKG
ncbi:MAG: transferase hexapeptide repeat family protein [Planctomycetes bacterium]|nr:transferase hexapeptide repeat family protein [Planctomycetota bacterium]NOG53723.1 transferase hexapeptide repeat family protein [Planctomycetota bacterium]